VTVHGRGVSKRLRINEPGDDGVGAGEPGLPRLDGGDDIAWMKNWGRWVLRAINSGSGIFGVAPGTGMKTNQKR